LLLYIKHSRKDGSHPRGVTQNDIQRLWCRGLCAGGEVVIQFTETERRQDPGGGRKGLLLSRYRLSILQDAEFRDGLSKIRKAGWQSGSSSRVPAQQV
jgi:hypothetical protein